MAELIVEVDVKNGLPGSRWYIKQEPRYLLAVVYELEKCQKHNSTHHAQTMVSGDKFSAMWEDGFVKMQVPLVDGDHRVFLFVLTRTLESMAKSLLEIKWGGKFLDAMLNQGQIAIPKVGRKLVV